MKKRPIHWLAVTLLIVALTGCTGTKRSAETLPPPWSFSSESVEMPTGDQVLDHYIEVTGGKSAYEGINSRRATGKLEIPAMSMNGPVSIWQQASDRGYMEADVEGMGLVQSGFREDVVWELNLLSGPRLLEGVEREVSLRSMSLHAEMNWRDYYSSAECVGREAVGARQAFKVILKPKQGKPVTAYYDADTGFLVRTDMIMETQMGEFPSVTLLEDYREVDGIMIPYVTRQRIMEIDQVMVLDSIEHNTEIPADRFDLPTEIQELVDKAARTGPADKG